MQQNFERCLQLVLAHEGGYVDHKADPGGATNLGITIGTLSGWLGRQATKAEVQALTRGTVAPIYRKNYWDVVKGDQLPSGVDYAVFDFAVNSGPSRAAIFLQEILGVAPDGKIGPITIAAAQRANAAQVVNRLCDDRLAFLRRLSTFPTFGKGWTSRVASVRAEALKMAATASPPAPKPADPAPMPQPRPQPSPEPFVSPPATKPSTPTLAGIVIAAVIAAIAFAVAILTGTI